MREICGYLRAGRHRNPPTPAQGVIMMAGTLRVRRSQGALSGVLLVLLGIWGALIPFVGPYFHYAYTPDRTWDATSGRLWLEVLPGVVTLAGGVVVLLSRFRPAVVLGAWLAALAGAWFAVGNLVAGRWAPLPRVGAPVGGATRAVLEQIGFFTGLGVVIVFVAALALGRFTVVAARDAAAAAAAAGDGAAASTAPDAPVGAAPGAAAEGAAASAARTTRPAGQASRQLAKVRAVPVFRGRQQGSAAANAAAGRAAAEADIARTRAAPN
jgi:hypothetical protein